MTQLFKLSGAALTLCALGAITTLPAQAVDPATLIGVGLKAAPHVINGVKSTLPHVFRSRSVIVEVSNQTNLNLRVTANRHKHGGFNSQLLPQDRIPAKHFNVFASGATGVATGTNGSVDYSGRTPTSAPTNVEPLWLALVPHSTVSPPSVAEGTTVQ
jgi:hypothetical protein